MEQSELGRGGFLKCFVFPTAPPSDTFGQIVLNCLGASNSSQVHMTSWKTGMSKADQSPRVVGSKPTTLLSSDIFPGVRQMLPQLPKFPEVKPSLPRRDWKFYPHWLCDLEQVPYPLCASFPLAPKWTYQYNPPQRVGMRSQCICLYVKNP